MILLHKLKGEPLWVNPDLVAFAEGHHDTVVTLLDGRHLVVSERAQAVAAALQEHRAATLALAFQMHADGVAPSALRLVPDTEEP
jgi:flagellar protein FlbD